MSNLKHLTIKRDMLSSNKKGSIEICEYDLSVPTFFHDEHNILHDLFESILCVSESYLLYKDEATGKEQKHLERVFAYELYRQWANRIEFNKNNNQPVNLIINGEIGKSLKKFDPFQTQDYKFPDLVLHSGQENQKIQGCVCEIKTNHITTCSFKNDIKKLCCFACSEEDIIRFKFGVFILMGAKMNRIINMMNSIEQEVFQICASNKYLDSIICVTYDWHSLHAVRFDQLIKKEDREKLRKIFNN